MNFHIEFDFSLTRNAYAGKYYAFEGIDGSGKTTQVQKLAEYIKSQGQPVLVTKEPTDGIIGELIHRILNHELTAPSIALQYLFAADRAIHLSEVVIPALEKGTTVISDRSFWSAVAYGIADLHLQENEKERMLIAHNVLALYGGYLAPDKTFVITVPAYIAMQRVTNRQQQQSIYEKVETLSKIEEEYMWMANKFPEVLKIINGAQGVEEVFHEVVSSI